MRNLTRRIFVRFLAAAPIVAVGARARAAMRFAVVSVANETQANLVIAYHWGNDPPSQKRLSAGEKSWFSWRFATADQDRAPLLFITFDSDASPSRYTEVKRLAAFAAVEENYELGHKYAFRYDGPSRRYIELWDITPAPATVSHSPPHGVRID